MKNIVRLVVVFAMALPSGGCATGTLLGLTQNPLFFHDSGGAEPLNDPFKMTKKVHSSFTVVTAHVVPAIPVAASGAAERRLHVCLTDSRGDDLLAVVAAPYPFTDRADPSPDIRAAAHSAAISGSELTRDDKPVKFTTAFEKGCGSDRQKDAAGTVPFPVFEAEDRKSPSREEGKSSTLPDGVKEGLVVYTGNHYTYLYYVSRSPVFGGHHSVTIDPNEAGVPDVEEFRTPDVVFLPIAVLFDVVTLPFQIYYALK